MSRVCLLLIAIAALATTVHAIGEPEDLGYGVVAALTEEFVGGNVQNFLTDVTPGVPVDVYFTLYHHRHPSTNLGGFECSWEMIPGNIGYQVLEMELLIWEAFNFGDEHDLLVGVRLPTPRTGLPVPLFKVTLMFTEQPDGVSLRLQPSSIESIPGEMVYADYVNPESLWAMKPNNAAQSLDDPVFWFNPSVAVEQHSLTAVKALFD